MVERLGRGFYASREARCYFLSGERMRVDTGEENTAVIELGEETIDSIVRFELKYRTTLRFGQTTYVLGKRNKVTKNSNGKYYIGGPLASSDLVNKGVFGQVSEEQAVIRTNADCLDGISQREIDDHFLEFLDKMARGSRGLVREAYEALRDVKVPFEGDITGKI
jgi:hypothetical protein